MIGLQHNVVNILYAIKGAVEVHRCRFEAGGFRDQNEALENAREMMQRIYRLAERALLITKKISLAMKMAPDTEAPLGPVSIKKAWREVIAIIKKRHPLNGPLEILSHIPEDFPKIFCNDKELTEILYCLADNAVQAMKNGGKLIIRASLGFRSGGDPIANIVIADTGLGIPKDTLGQLFEPFMTTKPSDHGNGLGLCIVKGLVRKNGGSITASSFQGCGTTFTLSFPVAKADSRKIERQYA